MKITVCTVVFNAADNIENTINSVLSQDYADIEYVIIDGESSDGTQEILKKYENKISRLLIEKDKGVYDAMNKALDLAQGDFLIFMNAGDTFVGPDVLTRTAELIKDGSAVYYGNVIYVNKGKDISYFHGGKFGKHRLSMKNICHQSVFYPKPVYKKYKYDLRYKVFSDYVYNLTLVSSKIKFIYINIVISFFETGGLSSSTPDEQFIKDRPKIILDKLGVYYCAYYLIKKNFRLRLALKNVRRFFNK